MGWGDVRYCFAMAILVIITSPRLLSGDVLLFYISFSLLLLLHHPDCCQVMYCYSIIILITSPRLLSGEVLLFYVSFSRLLLLLFLLHHPDCCRVTYCYSIIIIIPHIFVRSISRRCLDQTLWNLVGISYAMWSCAVKGWFFSKWLPLPWKRPKC